VKPGYVVYEVGWKQFDILRLVNSVPSRYVYFATAKTMWDADRIARALDGESS
jgi:hypothetical protein